MVPKRIITIARAPIPGIDPAAEIRACVIVAKVIVVVAVADEEIAEQAAKADAEKRQVEPTGAQPQRAGEIHGCEQQSAVEERIVPITAGKHAAVRAPIVTRRNPAPARVSLGPVSLPIGVAIVAIEPGAGDIAAAIIGRRRSGALIRIGRWFGNVLMVFLTGVGEMPADPTEPLSGLGPIPRHPAPPLRDIAPHAGDPD